MVWCHDSRVYTAQHRPCKISAIVWYFSEPNASICKLPWYEGHMKKRMSQTIQVSIYCLLRFHSLPSYTGHWFCKAENHWWTEISAPDPYLFPALRRICYYDFFFCLTFFLTAIQPDCQNVFKVKTIWNRQAHPEALLSYREEQSWFYPYSLLKYLSMSQQPQSHILWPGEKRTEHRAAVIKNVPVVFGKARGILAPINN